MDVRCWFQANSSKKIEQTFLLHHAHLLILSISNETLPTKVMIMSLINEYLKQCQVMSRFLKCALSVS